MYDSIIFINHIIILHCIFVDDWRAKVWFDASQRGKYNCIQYIVQQAFLALLIHVSPHSICPGSTQDGLLRTC